jgi:hypothetical protein
MTERRLKILSYEGKTPTFAMCENCHLKFFTPKERNRYPDLAEENLRRKFEMHDCKPGSMEPLRRRTISVWKV